MNACLVCGHPVSWHRIVDAIREREATGETLHDVLADYDWSLEKLIETESAIRAADKRSDRDS